MTLNIWGRGGRGCWGGGVRRTDEWGREGRSKENTLDGHIFFRPEKRGMDAISLSYGLLFSVCHRRRPCRAIGIAVKAATSIWQEVVFRKSGRMSWLRGNGVFSFRQFRHFMSIAFSYGSFSPSFSYEKTCPVTRFHESQPTYCIVEIFFPSRNILFFFRSSKSVQAIFSFLPILYSPLSPPFSPYSRPGLQILLPPPSPPLPLPFKENRNFLCPPFLLLLLLPFLMSFQRRTRVGIACFAFAAVGLVWE